MVSSYSTSIMALVHARQLSSYKSRQSPTSEALLVSVHTMPSRAGLAPGKLLFAEDEMQILNSILSSSISTRKMSQPHKSDVLKHIESCIAFHLAGHGISDPIHPSKSCLLPEDCVGNPLRVVDLTSLKLFKKAPWLPFLSACSTGESQSNALQDECIHLASACRLAGFPHVVGSL
ncbi:Putative CHAT domain-containing protein [Colletotrichum destructivum]|uniref:CHAT domain-containing protein n=1 Tax=Colletotrichum destructivum TaxID=34406 RepID=A0AAX4IUK2_9PEZI|nr:Putative CHAT domain-containing protein [Colletotrichum destructivum]